MSSSEMTAACRARLLRSTGEEVPPPFGDADESMLAPLSDEAAAAKYESLGESESLVVAEDIHR